MIKKTVIELFTVLVVGLTIGFVLSVAANLFVEVVIYFTLLRENSDIFLFSFFGDIYSYSPLIFLIGSAALVILIKKISNIGAWAGPADSILAANDFNNHLDTKRGYLSTLAALVCVSGGASVGQYGPIVHLGSTVGISIKKYLTDNLSNDIYLGCGVAAAISAGFNAPIAGVVFAHEAILRHFSIRAVAPIFIASVSARTFDELLFHDQTPSYVVSDVMPSLPEVLPFLIIFSPIFAIVAMAFMLSLRIIIEWGNKLNISPTAKPLLAAMICGIIAIWVPEILGLGTSTVNLMASGDLEFSKLLLVLVLKIAMTSLCLGLGLFGGVLSPALFVGIAAGSIVAQILLFAGFDDYSAILSVAGMAAVSASVIGAPIAIILIILELTSSYPHAVAAMIAVIICSLITNRIFGLSFFDRQLLDRGFDLKKGRSRLAQESTLIGSNCTQDYLSFTKEESALSVREQMITNNKTESYLVEDGMLRGKIYIFDLLAEIKRPLYDFVSADLIIILSTDTYYVAMNKASQFVGDSIPIIDEKNKLLGVLTEGDIFSMIMELDEEVRGIEHS
jgi:CIC family chloride channel protein